MTGKVILLMVERGRLVGEDVRFSGPSPPLLLYPYLSKLASPGDKWTKLIPTLPIPRYMQHPVHLLGSHVTNLHTAQSIHPHHTYYLSASYGLGTDCAWYWECSGEQDRHKLLLKAKFGLVLVAERHISMKNGSTGSSEDVINFRWLPLWSSGRIDSLC